MKKNGTEIIPLGTGIEEKDLLSAVDNVIIQMSETGDVALADNAIGSMLTMQKVVGRPLAKILWSVSEFWKRTDREKETGDTFEDYMTSLHDISDVQLRRYVRVWKHTDNNNIPKAIQSRPMKDQIAIATMLEQGFDPSKEQWKRLEHAADNNEVLHIIRVIKKKPAKKGSLQLTLERDGSIQAWMDDKKTFVGFLNLKDESSNGVLEKAITRIVTGAGMKRK